MLSISLHKTFIKILSFFIIVLLLAACQKEQSFEKNGILPVIDSPAVYNLVAASGNCSDATVTGDFVVGTTLTTASLMVTINVTVTGNWRYATTTVNGFSFSGSGKFTTTGSQSIFLIATGKPAAAGVSSFPLTMGSSVCSVSVTVIPAGTNGTASGDIYYKANIGGVNYSQSVTESNGYEAGSGLAGQDDVEVSGGINYVNSTLPLGLTEIGVGKRFMHNYHSASNADFKAFFAPGGYPFQNTADRSSDGVEVGWVDAKGEVWDTGSGTNDQTGSVFKIISVVDSPDAFGRYYLKIKMQFNCKLYNQTTGAMKLLINGELVAVFGKI